MLPREFHNEIYNRDEMILDHRRMGGCKKFCYMFLCCCSGKRQADKVFAKARMLASEELNITSIIKAQRQTAALASLAKGDDVEVIKKAVQRVIEVLDADLDVSETARKLKDAQAVDDENPNGDETQKPEDKSGVYSPKSKLLDGEEKPEGRTRKKDSETGAEDDGERKRDREHRGDRGDRKRDGSKRRGGEDDGKRRDEGDRKRDRSKRRQDEENGDKEKRSRSKKDEGSKRRRRDD